ncbi:MULTISPECIES: hypothetical protein [Pseudoalteromonas]|uniref:hypothetical protein n=1 Tax=Pseudoalteromonas TaxID=53246 RepID=UPI000C5CBC65|nr:hypothetical protein [Pseudoalteromonas sp. A41-2]MBU75450.1 hypothetical protein [Pseudoalteromonadaceae bacterium]QPL43510.1 hypothetical protein IT970_03340 [Pseudoalteromonas sp. A41-2]
MIQQFGTGLASCTCDLALYKKIAPDNAMLMHENKRYVRSNTFIAIFEQDPESVLGTLAKSFAGLMFDVLMKGLGKSNEDGIR